MQVRLQRKRAINRYEIWEMDLWKSNESDEHEPGTVANRQ